MAFFKTRKSGSSGAEATAAAPQTQSIEVMRRRAKHRLIGAAVLVAAGVVGFPLLFDSQPRPVSLDIPIEIPDKTKVKPLVLEAPAVPEPAASQTVAAASAAVPQETGASAPAMAASPVAPASASETSAPASAATPASNRFVVQVGAYSEAAKLREARQKLEKAGLKTYTQVVDSKEGKRTRLRVGPFASQEEADKAAARIKAQQLPAAVLKM